MSDRLPGQRFQNQPTSATPSADDDRSAPASATPSALIPQRYRRNAPVIGILIGVIILVLAAMVVWAGTRPQNHNQPVSSSPSSSQTPGFVPSPGWQGIEFTASSHHAKGYWQVSPPDYQNGLVTITTTITVEQGSLPFGFFVLDNAGTNDYETVGGTLEEGTVSAGDSQTGTIVFSMPKTDFTLYLATAEGTQITALLISY